MTRSKRLFRGSAVLGLALALSATPAEAQFDQFRSWWVCGGNAFNTCAAIEVGTAFSHFDDYGNAIHNVTMNVWNLSGHFDTHAGTVFTKVGFFNNLNGIDAAAIAGTLGMSGPARSGDDPNEWVLGDSNNAGGVNLELATSANDGSSSVNNSIASGCADNGDLPGGDNQLWMNPCADLGSDPTDLSGFLVLTFQIRGHWDLASSDLLIMGQNGPDGLSTQCITGENCEVVPEPITLVLLGTGMAGVAGANAIRRRRREDEVEIEAEVA